jgi:hypothetical protein
MNLYEAVRQVVQTRTAGRPLLLTFRCPNTRTKTVQAGLDSVLSILHVFSVSSTMIITILLLTAIAAYAKSKGYEVPSCVLCVAPSTTTDEELHLDSQYSWTPIARWNIAYDQHCTYQKILLRMYSTTKWFLSNDDQPATLKGNLVSPQSWK